MARTVLTRLLVMPALLVAASFVIFSMLYLTPGSPASALLGGKHVTHQTYVEVEKRYHLNDPFVVQYANWLWRAVHGDLGQSISEQDSVLAVITPRIVPTLELTAFASVLILVSGLLLGIVAAMRAHTVADAFVSGFVLLLSSVSPAIMAMLLVAAFAIKLPWFPALGLGGGGLDRINHLFLPAVALAASGLALVARSSRASMILALDHESIETARSRGLPTRVVVFKHALRHALIPPLTIAGLIAGYLISGSVVVEYAFGLNGLGALLVSAVEQKDFALVQAIALLMVLAFLVINLVIDLLYTVIDPRVRSRYAAAT